MEMENSIYVRSLNDDEVAGYRRDGWAVLRDFVDPQLIQSLLTLFRKEMGADAGRTSDRRAMQGLPSEKMTPLWQNYDVPSQDFDEVRALSHSPAIGRAVGQLLGKPVRFYNDQVICKLPVAGTGGPTPWHQDLPYHPFDRRGRISIWFPLMECPPEMGTMRFLTGTHMLPPLGRYVHRTDGVDTVSDNPWLLEQYEVSPPLHLYPGDVTIHDAEVIHSAPTNETDDLRWVYSSTYIPSDTLYTGIVNRRTDGLGLKVNQVFDHPQFPLI